MGKSFVAPPAASADGSFEVGASLVAGLEVEVDREDVVHHVVAAAGVDDLIEVADLGADRGFLAAAVAEAEERTVLIEAGVGDAVGVVEMEEDFVPADQRPFGATGQHTLGADHLSPTQRGVVAVFEPALLEAAAVGELVITARRGPHPLLPEAVFLEVFTNDRRSVDPCVAGPERLVLGDFDAEARSEDALVEAVGFVEEAAMGVEPPAHGRVLFVVELELLIGERGEPETGVVRGLPDGA